MKYGFIGSGRMASALLRGAVESGVLTGAEAWVSDAHAPTRDALAEGTGAHAAASNAEVASAADLIVVCVKPADVRAALHECDETLRGKLVVSIAAGVPLAALQDAAPGARVIRVMPNTPALIARGAAAYALGESAKEADAQATEKLFRAVGAIHCVPEKLLDAVTGVSGSGPAFVYLVIEALADGGVLMGLPRELALELAARTVAGAAEMVVQTGQHPAALRDMVTSPGGTTIAGLEALEQGGARAAFLAAVRAATERSRELGGGK